MIVLSTALLYEQLLLPRNNRKLDQLDHVLLWTVKICLVILFFTLPDAYSVVMASNNEEDTLTRPEFFFACSGGKLDGATAAVEQHPEWVNTRTENGETPLHLTGIYGHSEITKLLLENGADPNARSTFDQGLRMHPLSWNVYGGHLENIKLLLEHGADVNLDFDSMGQTPKPVTVLDVLYDLQQAEEGDQRFMDMEALLKNHGAKTMKELRQESGDEL